MHILPMTVNFWRQYFYLPVSFLTVLSEQKTVHLKSYRRWLWLGCVFTLYQICINNLPACLHHCPGARTFAYRTAIGLPRVPLAAAERIGGSVAAQMNLKLKSHMCVLCEVIDVLTMETYTQGNLCLMRKWLIPTKIS